MFTNSIFGNLLSYELEYVTFLTLTVGVIHVRILGKKIFLSVIHFYMKIYRR